MRARRQAAQQQQRRPVCPVEIIEHHHHWPQSRDPLERFGNRVEHPRPISLRVGGRRAGTPASGLHETDYGRVRARKWLERPDEGLVWDGGPFRAAPVQHERVVAMDRVFCRRL
jgi:hypothetical protein